MIRLIKRYESRKLYDTEESRYVSLEEIGDWVRRGQQVKVVDNTAGDDVTAQTLALVIVEEGRRGSSFFTSDLLHALIRRGEHVLTTGVEQLQSGVDRALRASLFDETTSQATGSRPKDEKTEAAFARATLSSGLPPASASGNVLRKPAIRPVRASTATVAPCSSRARTYRTFQTGPGRISLAQRARSGIPPRNFIAWTPAPFMVSIISWAYPWDFSRFAPSSPV